MSLISIFTVCVILLLVAVSIFLVQLFTQKASIDKKNLQLIQSYLELEFLHKNLIIDSIDESADKLCIRLLTAIKEYYHLEDILVIDSIKLGYESNVNFLKKIVYEYLCNQEDTLRMSLQKDGFSLQTIVIKNQQYVLYIFALAPSSSEEGFIICIEHYPSLLSAIEVLGLKMNVHLLRLRLLNII